VVVSVAGKDPPGVLELLEALHELGRYVVNVNIAFLTGLTLALSRPKYILAIL